MWWRATLEMFCIATDFTKVVTKKTQQLGLKWENMEESKQQQSFAEFISSPKARIYQSFKTKSHVVWSMHMLQSSLLLKLTVWGSAVFTPIPKWSALKDLFTNKGDIEVLGLRIGRDIYIFLSLLKTVGHRACSLLIYRSFCSKQFLNTGRKNKSTHNRRLIKKNFKIIY